MNYPCSSAAPIKYLEATGSPNSSFLTGTIHFLLLLLYALFSTSAAIVLAPLGLDVLFSFGKAYCILFPTV
jgi:hypothetical protein